MTKKEKEELLREIREIVRDEVSKVTVVHYHYYQQQPFVNPGPVWIQPHLNSQAPNPGIVYKDLTNQIVIESPYRISCDGTVQSGSVSTNFKLNEI